MQIHEMPAVTATSAATPSPASLKAPVAPANGQFDVTGLFVSDKAARDTAVATLAAIAQKDGPSGLQSIGFTDAAVKSLGDKKSPAAREGAANAVFTLAQSDAVKALEPLFIDSGLYAALLETFADKMPAARTAAVDAVVAYVKAMNPWATALILPALLHEIKTAGKWQVKTGSITVLNQLVVSAPAQTAKLTPDIVPILAEAIWDTKADVKKAARDSLEKTTALVSNKDIERFIPALIKALINPVEEVPNTINLLSATTFVSEVDSPTLSLMVPLLSRGLSEKLTATKRKVAVYVYFFFSDLDLWLIRPHCTALSTTCPNSSTLRSLSAPSSLSCCLVCLRSRRRSVILRLVALLLVPLPLSARSAMYPLAMVPIFLPSRRLMRNSSLIP